MIIVKNINIIETEASWFWFNFMELKKTIAINNKEMKKRVSINKKCKNKRVKFLTSLKLFS